MNDNPVSPASPGAALPEVTTVAEAARHQRGKVDALLGRPAVVSRSTLTLASGQALGYEVRAAFIPVIAAGMGAGHRGRGDPLHHRHAGLLHSAGPAHRAAL